MTGYGGAPASSQTDEVRFWIQDTDTSNYEFTDAEISYLLARYTDPILAASYGCDMLATKYAMQASLGDLSLGNTSQMYASRAASLRESYNRKSFGSTITISAPTKVRDSISGNYPSRFKHTDIESQCFGTDREDIDGNSI